MKSMATFPKKFLSGATPLLAISLLLMACGDPKTGSTEGSPVAARHHHSQEKVSVEPDEIPSKTAEQNLEPGRCQRQKLQVCLDYKGGESCFAKFHCSKETLAQPLSSAEPPEEDPFGTWYSQNYKSVVDEVRTFHQGAYGCAAFASTALKMFGFSVTPKKVTNELEIQLIRQGWIKISDMEALEQGDVVFTDKATSNLQGTYSHVYIFQNYEGKGYGRITDNKGNRILRNIGPGPRSRSVIAYRAPR
jgi:hypothetical protein